MNTNLKGTLAEHLREEMELKKLVNILKDINEERVKVTVVNNRIEEIEGDDVVLTLIQSLADDLLITEDGQCNWLNMKNIVDEGFDIYAGDKDDFGWLIGCIETKKGIILYG